MALALARVHAPADSPSPGEPPPLENVRQALAQLTDQERRVLAEVASGKSDKEIALALHLEGKTVRNYLVQVYRKLGVNSRTQAALLYQRSMRKPDSQETTPAGQ